MADNPKSSPKFWPNSAKPPAMIRAKPKSPVYSPTTNQPPFPPTPKLKQDAATKVFREGVYHKDQGADEAIKKLPDRIQKK